MKAKMFLTIVVTVAMLCAVMLAGFANANPTTVTAATSFTINGGTFAGNPMWVLSKDNVGPLLMGGAGQGAGIICTMSTSVNLGAYIAIYAQQISGFSMSTLTVWTAPTASGPWTQAGSPDIVGDTDSWHYFVCAASGQYISISSYNSARASGVAVDCVVTI